MKNSINKIKVFLADEQGAETAEWAVIVGLLVVHVPLPAGSQVSIQVKGDSLDSTFVMDTSKLIWAPAPVGQYMATWSLGGKTAVMPFEVRMEVHAPPKTNAWYLVGFGSQAFDFGVLKPASQVFSWDDNRTPGEFSRYVGRADLLASIPGFGYWYFAEVADTMVLAPVSQMPAPLAVPVTRGGTGWNMVSNPWSWPIRVADLKLAGDTSHLEFWTWDDLTLGYRPATTINPYMAAWVNVPQADTLTLDPTPDFTQNGPNTPSLAKTLFASIADFRVQAKLSAGSSVDEFNFFGVSPRVQNGLEPPASPAGGVALSFGDPSHPLARDLRTSLSKASWPVRLTASREELGTLQFSGANRLRSAGWDLVLVVEGKSYAIEDDAPVQVALRRGSVQGTVYALPTGSALAEAGLREPKVSQIGKTALVSFTVPVALAGSEGLVELIGADGSILARSVSSHFAWGENQVRLGAHVRGVVLVRVKIGSVQSSALAVFK